MIQTKEILEKMLADLQNQLQKANNELAGSPTGSLVRVKRGKGYMIFRVYSEQGKRVRKVITQNEEMINALARKVYLKAEADILQRDIEAASAFLQIFEEPVFDNIIRHIPERFLQYKLTEDDTDSWATQPYRQSTYMPERKVHTTSRGLRVRSKSELLIAEKLYEHGIPFRYEQILTIDGIDYAPDFTLMRADGTLVYWEHCGLTSSRGYMRRHWQKMQVYAEAGITPWNNLIVTYDDENGLLDLRTVESEIINRKEIHT